MITRVEIQNYRSFAHTETALGRFTLVIGANASGKTNFLKLFCDLNSWIPAYRSFRLPYGAHPDDPQRLMPHLNATGRNSRVLLDFDDGSRMESTEKHLAPETLHNGHLLELIRIDPAAVSADEKVGAPLLIHGDGRGVANALDAFKTGTNEEVFQRIVSDLRGFIPELATIGLEGAGEGMKRIVGREEGIHTPVPGSFLSEGTRTILALLVMIHQPSPPPLLLIEDLDHAIHPRLFEDVVGFLRRVCEERDIQIIATTHNPYLLDCFGDDPDSVLLVEKEASASRLVPVGDELRRLRANGSPESMSLAKLYLSGFLSEAP